MKITSVEMEWTDDGARVLSSLPLPCPRCLGPVTPDVLHVCGNRKPIMIRLTVPQCLFLADYGLERFFESDIQRNEIYLTCSEARLVLETVPFSAGRVARAIRGKIRKALEDSSR